MNYQQAMRSIKIQNAGLYRLKQNGGFYEAFTEGIRYGLEYDYTVSDKDKIVEGGKQ